MPQFTPLDAKLHRLAGWKQPTTVAQSTAHALADPGCRLVASEAAYALPYFPLAFRAQPGDIPFDLCAIFSLQPDLNLYIAPNGQWLTPYVPAWYRGYPFRLLPKEGSAEHMLCINTDSARLTLEPGEGDPRFFTPEGEMSEPLKAVLNFWTEYEKDHAQTQSSVQVLHNLGLIVPWPITLAADPAKPEQGQRIQGFYKIDPQKFAQLNAQNLQVLHRTGALSLAYAQMLSVPRLQNLGQLLQARQQAQNPAAPAPNPLDLLKGDTLNLNFLTS